jgi:basic membrane lipoprotein Med (substrate-binding protein (PBP1-ABC) superfamily)
MKAALVVALVAVLAGCGGRTATQSAPATTAAAPATQAEPRLRIGIVGPLQVRVPGARVRHGTLAQVAGDDLVLVAAQRANAATVARAADAHPLSHFALVGSSIAGFRRSNLVGIVLRTDQAARLGGIVAGLVATDEGVGDARVAWVGPEERALLAAFTRGVHEIAPRVTVLHGWSRRQPAACKEAALAVLARGAVVVMAHDGECASAAIAGAHDQNLIGLRISDFELPDVAADVVARDALAGIYRGDEDLVFGFTSGAIGVAALDPRIPQATALRARAAAQQLANGLRPSG